MEIELYSYLNVRGADNQAGTRLGMMTVEYGRCASSKREVFQQGRHSRVPSSVQIKQNNIRRERLGCQSTIMRMTSAFEECHNDLQVALHYSSRKTKRSSLSFKDCSTIDRSPTDK